MPPQQAHKSCFLMKPRGDGGRLLWIPSENNNGFLRMSTRLALLERAFIWHCLKKSLLCHKENRILMERWAAIMSLSIPFFFPFSFCKERERQWKATTSLYIFMKAALTESKVKRLSTEIARSWCISPRSIITFATEKKKSPGGKETQSRGQKRKKCVETKRGSFAAVEWYFLWTRGVFFFCGFRPVDILVTRCRPNVGGETRWEVCQPGSSDAVPCSSDVKDDQEW